ncbi:hypothetical protein MTO96_022936 [Rhipicephalus appendiculatus]
MRDVQPAVDDEHPESCFIPCLFDLVSEDSSPFADVSLYTTTDQALPPAFGGDHPALCTGARVATAPDQVVPEANNNNSSADEDTGPSTETHEERHAADGQYPDHSWIHSLCMLHDEVLPTLSGDNSTRGGNTCLASVPDKGHSDQRRPPSLPASLEKAAVQGAEPFYEKLDAYNPWRGTVPRVTTQRRGFQAIREPMCIDVEPESAAISNEAPAMGFPRSDETDKDVPGDSDSRSELLGAQTQASSSALSLEDCLLMNRQYQAKLHKAIEMLTEKLAQNRENQATIQEFIANSKKRPWQLAPRKRSKVVFGHPYFKDIKGMRAPDNEDTISRRRNVLQDPYQRMPKAWHPKEIDSFRTSIRNNLINTIKDSCLQRRENLIESQTGSSKREVRKEVKKLDAQVARLNELSLDQLLKMTHRGIDWWAISEEDNGVYRTPLQCELMWKNYLSGDSSPWAAEEDAKLAALVKKLGLHKWDEVASQMGGKRTAFQCAERHMQRFNNCLKTGSFSKDEDAQLLKLLKEHTVEGEIQWNKVTMSMPSRTRMQLSYRWDRVLNPNLRRGKFSYDEDKMLVMAVEAYGENWAIIKDFLPGRTRHQCRERQVNQCRTSLQ